MEICCSDCFGDEGLSEFIRSLSKTPAALKESCPWCKSVDGLVCSIEELQTVFQMIIDAYVEDKNGTSILQCLRQDWALFHSNRLSLRDQEQLLTELIGEEYVSKRFILPKDETYINGEKSFQYLNETLRRKNRWFVEWTPLREELSDMLVWLMKELSSGAPYYRGRVMRNGKNLTVSEMGSPPPELASGGRANPVGIPYLYLASTKETAFAEIRAKVGQRVAIAEFDIRGARILDLATPRVTASPFQFEETAQVRDAASKMHLLEAIGQSLAQPHTESEDLNYIPTQYICEFVKSIGFDGVLYGSSQSEGLNVVLFHPARWSAKNVKYFEIQKVETKCIAID